MTFTLDPRVGARVAVVCGEWNGWVRDVHVMERDDRGGFSLTIALEPGRRYRFRYLLDGERWENDWEADAYEPNDFGEDDSIVDLTVGAGEEATGGPGAPPRKAARREDGTDEADSRPRRRRPRQRPAKAGAGKAAATKAAAKKAAATEGRAAGQGSRQPAPAEPRDSAPAPAESAPARAASRRRRSARRRPGRRPRRRRSSSESVGPTAPAARPRPASRGRCGWPWPG